MPAGAVHGVDHGVSFHVEPKLRTVLWGWAGTPVRESEVEVLERLARADAALGSELAELLTRARGPGRLRRRIQRLLATGRLPYPTEDWPAIPWPPF